MNTAGAPPRIRGASKARGDGRKIYVPDAFGSGLGRAGRLFEMRHGAGAGKSVGQCNDIITDYTIKMLAALPGKPKVLAVGERVHARLADAGLNPIGLFAVPNSVQAITPQRPYRGRFFD